MPADEELDERLGRLRDMTEGLRARGGFADAVMQAVAAQPSGWIETAWRASLRMVPVAALCAMAALIWAVQSESAVDEELAIAHGIVEMDW
ncbi:MAG TPA: hypothetical protein VF989_17055 [Polyangiaceae bacterium]|jgi:hypothetical protein